MGKKRFHDWENNFSNEILVCQKTTKIAKFLRSKSGFSLYQPYGEAGKRCRVFHLVEVCLWIEDLQSVFLLELKILLVEGVDSINHGLDKLDLGVSETVLVGDIVSGTCKY